MTLTLQLATSIHEETVNSPPLFAGQRGFCVIMLPSYFVFAATDGEGLMRTLLGVASICFLLTSAVDAQPIGPTPYLSFENDSPVYPAYSNRRWLEDFEDGLFNTPFVTQVGGQSITPSGGVFTDSVDSDDGTIDGSGLLGRSHYTADGATGITYIFSEMLPGFLPQIAGIVWTDSSAAVDVFLEAFDEAGVSLGVISAGPLGDGSVTGETAEDRFLGWQHLPGISRLHVYQSGSDMEVDHLQFALHVPEPATIALALAGLGFMLRKRLF